MEELVLYVLIFGWVFIRYYYLKNGNKVFSTISATDFNDIDSVLVNHIPYYKHLSSDGKQIFISRLIEVKENLEIRGREGFGITQEVKVIISASLTQLTMGFKSPIIPFLKGVVVFPDIFYSRLIDRMVKGLAMGTGVVFISWKHFLEGYEDSADTYNLGLHEFAHILHFESEQLSHFDNHLNSYYEEWQEIGYPVFLKLRSEKEGFLRQYGGVNQTEFFSVCVENFFEVPQKFEKELPDLYYHLCYLLKQNPINKLHDYAFETDDMIEANNYVKESVPIYSISYSNIENVIWRILGKIILVFVIIELVLYSGLSEESRIIFFRSLVISLSIFMLVRWMYYSDHKSIINKSYLIYIALKLVPMLSFLLVIYKAFVS